jgi:uncharacterized membrane protein
MDILSISSAILGFFLSRLKNSKGVKKVTEEVSLKLMKWIKLVFAKDDTLLKDLEKSPDNKLNQNEVLLKIQKYLKKNQNEVKDIQKLLSFYENQGNQVIVKDSKIKAKGNISFIGGNQINKS